MQGSEFLKILKCSSRDPQLAKIHPSLIKDAQAKSAEIISRAEGKQPELIPPLQIEKHAQEPEPAPPLQIEEKAKTPVPLKTEPQKTSDPKGELAQLCQSPKYKLELSKYKTVASNSGSGYTSTISAKGKGTLFLATETASSKRDAEKAAARSLRDNILAGSVVTKKKREKVIRPTKPTGTSHGKSIPPGTKASNNTPPLEGVDAKTLEESPPQTLNDITSDNEQDASPEKFSLPKPIKSQNKKAVKQQQNPVSKEDQADRKVGDLAVVERQEICLKRFLLLFLN